MFEIRNYQFEPSLFDEYKAWAKTLGVPYFKKKMDIVGFWVVNDDPPIFGGSLPQDAGATFANIVWIIRWDDRAQRDRVWEETKSDPEKIEIFSTVPGGMTSYLKTEVKFAEEI